MSHSFFNSLPARSRVARSPALSRHVGEAASPGVGQGSSAAVELPFAAVAAYLVGLLYHRPLRPSVEQKCPVGALIGCTNFNATEGRGPC